MRLAFPLVLLLACGGSKTKPDDTTTTTTTTEPTTTTTTTTTTTATNASTTPAPPTNGTSPVTVITTSSGAVHGGSKPTPTAQKPYYSCFSYTAKNSTQKRNACMRTEDCGPYLEQAKSVAGIRELTGCASVQTVFCFHQVGTKDDPEGLDVCQPTLDQCKAARADVVKAKMSVDTDCAQRS